MGIFDIFKKKKPVKVEAPREPRAPKKTEKELATEKGEPWVGILSMDIDPENMHQGAFELDWNDHCFIRVAQNNVIRLIDSIKQNLWSRWYVVADLIGPAHCMVPPLLSTSLELLPE